MSTGYRPKGQARTPPRALLDLAQLNEAAGQTWWRFTVLRLARALWTGDVDEQLQVHRELDDGLVARPRRDGHHDRDDGRYALIAAAQFLTAVIYRMNQNNPDLTAEQLDGMLQAVAAQLAQDAQQAAPGYEPPDDDGDER